MAELSDRVASPQDPTIAYRANGTFSSSLFFELDTEAINGNWPDKLPEAISSELAQAKCGPPVEALLTRIATVFPAAHVVIIGYYPILSEKTANDLFMRALAKRFYTPEPGAPKMNDKALRARLITISREWYETSDQMLSAAARNRLTSLCLKARSG